MSNEQHRARNKLIDDNVIYTETDTKGLITFVTNGFINISGFSRKELIGKNHNMIRHKDTPNETFESMWSSLKKGKEWHGEVKNIKKNGEIYWVETVIRPLFDSNNNIIGYGSLKRDITKEKEETKKREILFNSTKSIIFITDGYSIKEINDLFFNEYGFEDLNDFNSKHNSISELFISEENENYLSETLIDIDWISKIDNSVNTLFEVCMETIEGEKKIYSVDITNNISFSNYSNVFLVKFTEITKLKNQLNLFKGQSRFSVMGEMVAMIAHQWRQPLAALSGIVEHLDSRWQRGKFDNDFFERKNKQQKDIIEYLNQTITDFLTFFKEDNKNEEKYIDVKELMSMSYKLTEAMLRSNSIKYEINYNGNENLRIKIASTKFDQILINIIKNALEELIEREVKEPSIFVSIEKETNFLNIKISDNAGGIKKEIIPYIFDPYFSTKGKNGTGIGLYMSKILMERHIHGTIDVENKEKGVEFTLKIPI